MQQALARAATGMQQHGLQAEYRYICYRRSHPNGPTPQKNHFSGNKYFPWPVKI